MEKNPAPSAAPGEVDKLPTASGLVDKTTKDQRNAEGGAAMEDATLTASGIVDKKVRTDTSKGMGVENSSKDTGMKLKDSSSSKWKERKMVPMRTLSEEEKKLSKKELLQNLKRQVKEKLEVLKKEMAEWEEEQNLFATNVERKAARDAQRKELIGNCEVLLRSYAEENVSWQPPSLDPQNVIDAKRALMKEVAEFATKKKRDYEEAREKGILGVRFTPLELLRVTKGLQGWTDPQHPEKELMRLARWEYISSIYSMENKLLQLVLYKATDLKPIAYFEPALAGEHRKELDGPEPAGFTTKTDDKHKEHTVLTENEISEVKELQMKAMKDDEDRRD